MFIKFKILFIFFFINNIALSNDIREFEIGMNIEDLPETGYIEIRCLNALKVLKVWQDYKKCEPSENNLFYITFQYDDKYAFNENFEGTQIAGHPVVINIGIKKNGILQEINVTTDDKAPFYFKKQAHLFWVRILSKYGSEAWQCKEYKKKNDHIIINKKYVNKSCFKNLKNKKISYHTQLFFIGNKEKDSLVSKTLMSISLIENNKI